MIFSSNNKLLYYSLVYPFLTSGLIFWGNNYSTTLSPVVKLNRVLRWLMVKQVPLCCIVCINALKWAFISNNYCKCVLFYKPQGTLRSEYKVNIRLTVSCQGNLPFEAIISILRNAITWCMVGNHFSFERLSFTFSNLFSKFIWQPLNYLFQTLVLPAGHKVCSIHWPKNTNNCTFTW